MGLGKAEHRSATFNIPSNPMTNHACLAEVVVVRSPRREVTPIPPSHTALFRRKSLCRAYVWGVRGYVLLLSGHGSYINYLEFCKQDFPSSPFIPVFDHLYQYGLIYFVVWAIIQYFIWLLKMFQLLYFLFPDSPCIFPVYFLFD